jgi:hypothetical protein
MKAIATFAAGVAVLAVATAAWPGAGSVPVSGTLVAGEAAYSQPLFVASLRPDYIAYSNEAAPLPDPNCFWTRVPVYDEKHDVVGWRGRPLAVCPQESLSARAGD